MPQQQFDPKQPEKGWTPAVPIREPRIWKLWRFLGIGDFKKSKER